MKQTIYLFYLATIFIVAFLLTQAIFPALGAVLLFIVFQTLLEVSWHYRRSVLVLAIIRPLARGIVITAVSLALYCLTYLPVEYFITEIKYQLPEMPTWAGMSVLVFWIIISGFILLRIKINTLTRQTLIIALIFCAAIFYHQYHSEKIFRQYVPKIYNYNHTWGVQGQQLTIEGKNFGAVWQEGTVYAGENHFVNLTWSDNKIVVEQPVCGDFGVKILKVLRWDGQVSNPVNYELRDPALLYH